MTTANNRYFSSLLQNLQACLERKLGKVEELEERKWGEWGVRAGASVFLLISLSHQTFAKQQ